MAKATRKPRSGKSGSSSDSFTTRANGLVTILKGARKEVPGFEILEDGASRSYTSLYVVPAPFIQRTVDALGSTPKLAAAVDADPRGLIDAIRLDAAYAAAEKEAMLLAAGIHGARVARYVEAVQACDEALGIARGMLKRGNKRKLTGDEKAALAELQTHVNAMSGARKQKRKTADKPRTRKKGEKGAAPDDKSNGAGAAGARVQRETKTTSTTIEEKKETSA